MTDHTRPPNCKAEVRGDQWFCDKCQYVWDINDDDPPDCDVAAEFGHDIDDSIPPGRNKEKARQAVDNIKEILK